MKKFLLFFLAFFIVSFFFISMLNFYIRYYPITDKTIILKIPSNISAKIICKILKNKGVIPTDKILFLLIKLNHYEKIIKSGEYKFDKGLTYLEILDILVKGKVCLYKITVPEGLNIYEIAKILAKKEIIFNEDDFLEFCFNKQKIKKYLNNGFSLEGYLFPDTYKFHKFERISKVISEMNKNFKQKVLKLYKKSNSYYTLNEIIILASIIQKETYNKKEMPIIASVFFNRIKKGMRLQSDPTIIYGLWESFKGKLSKKDIKKYTVYNTYLNYGLPPTPISNPGLAAIKAALYPAKTNYLYFVATKWGYHVFATNYKQHLLNIKKYLKVR